MTAGYPFDALTEVSYVTTCIRCSCWRRGRVCLTYRKRTRCICASGTPSDVAANFDPLGLDGILWGSAAVPLKGAGQDYRYCVASDEESVVRLESILWIINARNPALIRVW
jgi:hypothetical protein